MVNSKLANIFIFITFLLLMGNTVLPHHHHGSNDVCFQTTNCCSHQEHNGAVDHNHQKDNDCKLCNFVYFSNLINQEDDELSYSFYSHEYENQFLNVIADQFITEDTTNCLRLPELDIPLFDTVSQGIIILRAPPVSA